MVRSSSSTVAASDDNNSKSNLRRCPWRAKEADISSNINSSHHAYKKSSPAPSNNKRCGRNSRIKWSDSSNKHHDMINFNEEEDELIIRLHSAIGSRWAIIAQQIPGRTDNDVKNHWNTKLKKKLTDLGIDPVTHKPFSQLAIDYRNIGYGGGEGCDYDSTTTTMQTESSASSNYYYKHDLKKMKKSKSVFRAITEPPYADGNPNPRCRQLFMEAAAVLPSSTTAISRDCEHDQITGMRPQFYSSVKNDAVSSLDLLYQLQTVTLVTADHNLRNSAVITDGSKGGDNRNNLHFPSSCDFRCQVPSSISSSFPSSNAEEHATATATTGGVVLPEPFSWRDFLLDEEITMMQEGEQEDNSVIMKGSTCVQQQHGEEIEEIAASRMQVEEEESMDLETSFVDRLLGKEKELQLLDDFLGVLEEDSC